MQGQQFDGTMKQVHSLYSCSEGIYFIEDNVRHYVNSDGRYYSIKDDAVFRVDAYSLEFVEIPDKRKELINKVSEDLSGKTFQDICCYIVDNYLMQNKLEEDDK